METVSEVNRRLMLAIVVFAICYLFIYKVPFLLIPVGLELRLLANVGGLAAAVAIAWFVWSGSKRAPAGLLSWVLCGAAVVGVIAFAASVLSGPLLFPTKPNQGVLAGVYFVGPAGAVVGGVAGSIVSSIRAKSGRANMSYSPRVWQISLSNEGGD